MYSRNCKSFGIIPDAPRYCIDRNDGTVRDSKDLSPVNPIDKDTIMLDGVIYRISKLMVHTFIGVLPCPIVPETIILISTAKAYRYTYAIKSIIVDPDDDQCVWINDIEFRHVPHTEKDIVVSKNGVAYSLTDNRFVRKMWSIGYASFGFRYIESDYPVNNSTLVAATIYRAYRGEIPAGMEVDHIDNYSYHDELDNLQLLSRLDNTRKSRYEGKRGTPYTLDMMDAACKAISENQPNSEVAKILGLDYDNYKERKRTIKMIYKLKNQKGYYDDLKAKYDMTHYDINVNYDHTRLSDNDVEMIRQRLLNGELGRTLAKEYHVSPAIISRIRHGNR